MTAHSYLSSGSPLRFQLRPVPHTLLQGPSRLPTGKGKPKYKHPCLRHLKSRESPLLPTSSSWEVPFSLSGNPQPTKHFLLDVPLALQIQLQETNLFPLSRRVVLLSSYPHFRHDKSFSNFTGYTDTLALSGTCFSFFFILFLPDRLSNQCLLPWTGPQISSFPYNPTT